MKKKLQQRKEKYAGEEKMFFKLFEEIYLIVA